MAGWALFLSKTGVLKFVYNWFGKEFTEVSCSDALADGVHEIKINYAHDGGFGAGGLFKLFTNKNLVEEKRISRTVPVIFSMSGETFDVGRNTGSPVADYPSHFPFTGRIIRVVLERLSEKDGLTQKKEARARFAASLSAQ